MPLDREFGGVIGQAMDGAVEPGSLGHVDEQVVDAAAPMTDSIASRSVWVSGR